MRCRFRNRFPDKGIDQFLRKLLEVVSQDTHNSSSIFPGAPARRLPLRNLHCVVSRLERALSMRAARACVPSTRPAPIAANWPTGACVFISRRCPLPNVCPAPCCSFQPSAHQRPSPRRGADLAVACAGGFAARLSSRSVAAQPTAGGLAVPPPSLPRPNTLAGPVQRSARAGPGCCCRDPSCPAGPSRRDAFPAPIRYVPRSGRGHPVPRCPAARVPRSSLAALRFPRLRPCDAPQPRATPRPTICGACPAACE